MQGSHQNSSRRIQDIYALTATQKGILYHCLQDPSAGHYRVQLSLSLSGELDESLVRQAWQQVATTNEALRTSFRWEKLDGPVQIVWKNHFPDIRWVDHRDGLLAPQVAAADWKEGFELSGVPFRVTVYRETHTAFIMIVSHHHILYDGWSSGILLKEFFLHLHALSNGNVLTRIQKPAFKSFVTASRVADIDLEGQAEYWRRYLEGYEPPPAISLRPPENISRETGCSTLNSRLQNHLVDRIVDLSGTLKVSTAAILFSAWGILWQKFTYSDDVVFGIPDSGRPPQLEGIDSMVGLFIRTLPLRVRASGNEPMRHIISIINEHLQEKDGYSSLPLVEIKRCAGLNEQREWLDTLVAVENYPLEERLATGDFTVTVESYQEREAAPYRLMVNVKAFDGLSMQYSYDPGVFDRETIEGFSRCFQILLEQMVSEPDRELRFLSVLSEHERSDILSILTGVHREIPEDETFVRMIDRQMEKTPDVVALVGRGGHFSYRFLHHVSMRIAIRLTKQEARRRSFVAVMMKRTIELPAVLLGILASGAAYVPLDPDYPVERIKYMLSDSGAGLLVVHPDLEEKATLLDFDGQVLVTGDSEEGSFPAPEGIAKSSPSDYAYLIYTSGSTGNPKGILVNQRNIVNFTAGIIQRIPFGTESTVMALTTVCFDIFFLEMLLPLCAGARVVIAMEEEQREPDLLRQALERYLVSILQLTPSRMGVLLDHWGHNGIPRNIRELLVGGEEFPHWLFRSIRNTYHGRLYNVYGPTEATVWVTMKELENDGPVTVGAPLCNTGVLVLDRFEEVCPHGWVGELCISGKSLASGYHRNHALTEERFVNLEQIHNRRFYRTGDLARHLPGGEVDILGRIDRQLKLRGYRIELQEIESHLQKHPAISRVVADLRDNADNDRFLCAYLVGTGGLEAGELRAWLAEFLPEYMLPSYFIWLEEIPLTPNGKVDHSMLPQPEGCDVDDYTSPASGLESRLVSIWSSVLGIEKERLSVTAGFFAMGGHSIAAMNLAARIHRQLGVKLSVAEVMKTPTIRQMAGVINDKGDQLFTPIPKAEEKPFYPVSPSQKGMFLVQQMDPNSCVYNLSQVFGFRKEPNLQKLRQAFEVLIQRHEILRTSFHLMDGQPVQKIHPSIEFDIPSFHIENERLEQALQSFIKPFYLAEPPLMRAVVIEVTGAGFFMCIDLHHIIADEFSLSMLLEQFTSIYRNGSDVLPKQSLQYKDYSQWLLSTGRQEELRRQEEYWSGRFAGELPEAVLPGDFYGERNNRLDGGILEFSLNEDLYVAVNRLKSELQVSLFTLLFGVYTIMLAKFSSCEDIIVATPVAGREYPGLDSIAGNFVNLLALRSFPRNERSIKDYVRQVHRDTLEAMENSGYPFDRLVGRLGLKREAGKTPLFQAIFNMNHLNPASIISGNESVLTLSSFGFPAFESPFTLLLVAEEPENGIDLRFVYSMRVFKKSTIESMKQNFVDILRQLTNNLDVPIGNIVFSTGARTAGAVFHRQDDGDFNL